MKKNMTRMKKNMTRMKKNMYVFLIHAMCIFSEELVFSHCINRKPPKPFIYGGFGGFC